MRRQRSGVNQFNISPNSRAHPESSYSVNSAIAMTTAAKPAGQRVMRVGSQLESEPREVVRESAACPMSRLQKHLDKSPKETVEVGSGLLNASPIRYVPSGCGPTLH